MDENRYSVKGGLLVALALLLWGALFGATRLTRAQATGPNLLTNGDFEQGFGEAWPFQDGIPEVQVAPGWRAFWNETPPPGTKVPNYCKPEDQGCYWARPEFRGMSTAEFAYRVHGGNLSQKYFTYNRQHEAGLYQKVDGIEPGTRLRFQIYAQTWSCLGEEGNPLNCPTGHLSNNPAPFHTKVGIDPTGGTNPWAPTVVWSPEQEAHDTWTLFSVEATAEANSVTVFFYSRVDWPESWPRVNNDVYLDDASLVVVGEVTPTAPPPPPTSAVPPTPVNTPTPRPDGAVVHIVQPGDTLFGIALQYGVDLDELRRLNAGTLGPNDLLSIGQEVVISGEPIVAATPTTVPTEPQPVTPTLTVETEQPPTTTEGTPGGNAICVLAFNDQNGDMVYQAASEALVPNAMLSLLGTNGPVGTHTTDGLNEPYCFQNLQPGNYVLRQTPPAGYQPSGPGEQGILLNAGQTYMVHVGYVRSDGDTAPQGEATTSTTEQPQKKGTAPGDVSTFLSTIVRVSGILALLLAIAVGVLFVLSRR
ncbi:MAG: LysM peptidoglycan-binding domain-containing protein [Anaerolineae bacterium]